MKGIPTVFAKVRGSITLDAGPVGKPIQPDKQAVKVTVADADGQIFVANAATERSSRRATRSVSSAAVAGSRASR